MANKRNLKVDLAEFETTNQQSNIVAQQRNNSDTHQHNNATTQEVQQPKKPRAQRSNGSTYYLEDYLRKKMKMASALQDIDMQNIVRASVDFFFDTFGSPDGMGLTQAGLDRVGEYLKKMEERALII